MTTDVLSILKALIEGISVGFLASIPLGPIGVICIQRTLNKGRMSGFASGAGAASSDFLYALVAGFSVSMVTNFIETHKDILLVGGAIVLITLGLRMILASPKRQVRRKPDRRKSSLWQDYASTFFLTITNPLVLFVFIGAFSLIGVHDSRFERMAIVGGVLCGALTWWFTLTMMVGLFRKHLTIRRLFYVNRIAGVVIVMLVIITASIELFKHL